MAIVVLDVVISCNFMDMGGLASICTCCCCAMSFLLKHLCMPQAAEGSNVQGAAMYVGNSTTGTYIVQGITIIDGIISDNWATDGGAIYTSEHRIKGLLRQFPR